MTDDRGDGKTSKRIEPEIRINDDGMDNDFNSSKTLYSGDLFDRSSETEASEHSLNDDFELNKFSYEPDSGEQLASHQATANSMSNESEFSGKRPIIPNEGATHIPPAAGTVPTSSLIKQYKNIPLAIILAAVVILVSVYAMWSGSGQPEKVAVIAENPPLQIEETGKLQNQEIEELRQQISELEKKQQLLIDQKTSLESQLRKQADKHKADMTALKQKQLAESKAIKDEFNGKLADIRAAKQKPKSTMTASKPQPPAQPAAASPVTKKRPVIRKPKVNLTDLPGPIESVADVNDTVSPASTNRVKSWGVNLMSLGTETAARQEIQRLKTKGIQAESLQVSSGSRNMYRIRVAGFASKQEALDMQTILARDHGLKDTWINNQ